MLNFEAKSEFIKQKHVLISKNEEVRRHYKTKFYRNINYDAFINFPLISFYIGFSYYVYKIRAVSDFEVMSRLVQKIFSENFVFQITIN